VFASLMIAEFAQEPMQVSRSAHFVAAMLAVEQDWRNPEAEWAELAPALLVARGEIAVQDWETAVFDSPVAGFAWQHPAEAVSAFGCIPTRLAAQAGSFASAGHSKA
jgi:hypothetical protein